MIEYKKRQSKGSRKDPESRRVLGSCNRVAYCTGMKAHVALTWRGRAPKHGEAATAGRRQAGDHRRQHESERKGH